MLTLQSQIQAHRGKLIIVAMLCFLSVLWMWLVDLDKIVVERMSSRQWSLPARVYARPMELYAGLELNPNELERELDWLGYSPSPAQLPGHYAVSGSVFTLFTRGFLFSDGAEAPRLIKIDIENSIITTLSTDEDSVESVRLEPLEIGAIHPELHEDRVLVNTDTMPEGFEKALTAVEDKRFYDHHGVSIRGILRAAWINVRSGSKRQGASTLTQQLVKNLFLTSEKSWRRKITEAFMALVMEYRYDKDTILQTFANEVFIAQDGDRAIHGFGLASQYFFNRPLSELQPYQYSLLIGMLKAPTSYNPVRRPERATARRNLVLKIMHDDGLLDDLALSKALLQPLDVNSAAHNTGGNPAYLDAVRRQLLSEYALEDLQNMGLRIFTNYDPLLQHAAEQSVAATLSDIQTRYGEEKIPDEFLEAAMVLIDPNTGEIKALIGGRQSRYAGFNRALDAYRPVGSLLKPAVFLTAWSRPEEYTLSSIIDDEPVALAQRDGSIWTPENYNQAFEGPVPAIHALSRSLNLATVHLGLALGVDNVINTINKLGINAKLPEIPALLLGAHAFTVMDMARMYQTIAADGFTAPLRTIREVIDSEGQALSQYSLDVTRQIDPASLYLLKFAMTETMLAGTGKSVYNLLPDQFYVAGKTGTSDEQRDSWFAGFSGDYLAVVWLGNDQNQSTPLTGSSGALKVWSKLFSQISRKAVDFTPPPNVSYHATDLTVNKRVPARCRKPLELPYIDGSEPRMGKRCHSSESALGSWIKSLLR